jgi:hypothetical protein
VFFVETSRGYDVAFVAGLMSQRVPFRLGPSFLEVRSGGGPIAYNLEYTHPRCPNHYFS